jgi:hypothetical protein
MFVLIQNVALFLHVICVIHAEVEYCVRFRVERFYVIF